MKCADPVLCYTSPNGKRIFRHFSLATDTFIKHMHQIVFNCGKCLICRKKKAYELAARCVLHASMYKQNCFLTLTYDEKKEGYHNNFNYEDVQKFKKSLREYCSRTHDKKIEIFNVHEYGKNGKKHWHLIVFNHDFDDKKIHTYKGGLPLYTSERLSKLWKHGNCAIGDVSEASAMYQAMYMEKDFQHNNVGTSKKAHSRHSGIGRPYFLKHYDQILKLGYVPFNGRKMPLPRYFEKLAHKHYSHFYEKHNFFETKDRKRLYAPFKLGEENKNIADLFFNYKLNKQEKIEQLEKEWNETIEKFYSSDQKIPDFVKSNENRLYDLRNKNNEEKF